VVVDRHALSVASGARASSEDFDKANLNSKKNYGRVKDAYIKAADHINKQNGATINDPSYLHPHQIQAITWVVRQRLNDAEDGGKIRTGRKEKWGTYSGTHLPGASYLFREDVLRMVESYREPM
jgi:hypothetical protein